MIIEYEDKEESTWPSPSLPLTFGRYASLSPWSFQRRYQQSPSGLLYPSLSQPAASGDKVNLLSQWSIQPRIQTNWTYEIQANPPQLQLPSGRREQPVVGYRAWIPSHRQRLGMEREITMCATAANYVWKLGRNQASCTAHQASEDHQAPEPWCSCGFWVLSTLDQLEDHLTVMPHMVVGAVMGWGKVVQHGEVGWRAQYAKPLALLDLKMGRKNRGLAQEVAKAYRLPIFERSALEMVVGEHDGLLPSDSSEGQTDPMAAEEQER